MKLIIAVVLSLAVGLGAGFGLTKTFAVKIAAPTKASENKASHIEADEPETPQEILTLLRNKKGTDFDKEFLNQMMMHNQTAIEMAGLVDSRTEREEMKKLAKYIEEAQISDINQMKTWYGEWGFRAADVKNNPDVH